MLLLVVLCLAVFPISTFAADAVQVQIPVSIQTSGETPSPEENYTVELQAVDDAPMPSENVLEISGSGKAFFHQFNIQLPAFTITPLHSSLAHTNVGITTRQFIM